MNSCPGFADTSLMKKQHMDEDNTNTYTNAPNGSTSTAAGPAKVTPVSAVIFPEIAWRGPFADYRNAMIGTSECSDTVHFVTFWAAMAARVGRKISMWSGSVVYPNAYLGFFGDSNDKKTTGQ